MFAKPQSHLPSRPFAQEKGERKKADSEDTISILFH